MKQLLRTLAIVYRCDRGATIRSTFYVVLLSLLPLVNLYILKLLIDSIEHGVSGPWGLYLGIMCGIFLLTRVISSLSSINRDVLGQRMIDYMSDIVQRQATSVDMASFDRPEYHDIFHRAQQESVSRPLQILDSFMSLFGTILSLVGVTIMLITASWWVVLVMVAVVMPSFVVRLYKARRIYAFRRNNTQLYRRTSYLSALLTSRESAKEIRAFRLASIFRGHFVETRAKLSSRLLSISRRIGMLDIVCAVIEALAMLAVVALLIRQSLAGAISVGTFVMLFEAFRRGQGYMSTLVSSVATLYDNRLFISNLFEFLSLKPLIVSPSSPTPVPEKIDTIELRDVTFRYPDMERNVLEHFNLEARVGEVCRLEGHNGFGKSTVIKLILRLYDPDGGAVMVNGIDIRQFDIAEWRSRVAVLFQDFVRYAFTVDENLSFGNDKPNVKSAASLLSFVDRLPKGYDTLLGRVFDGGSELSMGQWQRIAISRAVASDAPVLLLDEPLAWLDNASRNEFNGILEQITPNRIVIIISHR